MSNNSSATIGGIGVIGDSMSDEYRADDKRGGDYAATTLNWVELLVRKRGYDFGPWGNWGGSRRTGYEYNWALSGARARDIIDLGQHVGLAGQVASGKVRNVILQIGANDFGHWNGSYQEIYDGSLSDGALEAKVEGMVSDIFNAVDTVKSAGHANLSVANVGDRGLSPFFIENYPDPLRRRRVTEVVMALNQRITAMATERKVPIIDVYGRVTSVLSQVGRSGNLFVAGEPIHLLTDGDEPHHLILADREHAGTVASGILANLYFLQHFREHHGLPLTPFTEDEIVVNAGIRVLSR